MTPTVATSESGQISTPDAKRVRHVISEGLSFVESCVRNLSGGRPDLPQALKMYSIGVGKIKSLVKALDEVSETNEAERAGYNGTKESTYTANHPDVVSWTQEFERRVSEKNIFDTFVALHSAASREKSATVGVLWHRFSEFMPWFLCQAAATVSNNEKRHYVIQTAFEELGMRDAGEIHPDMFWTAAQTAGVTVEDRERIRLVQEPTAVLNGLRSALLGTRTDAEVLGLLLGLEIPAIENIETILKSLSHDDETAIKLNEHKFFKLHRQIEIEHVRLTVANFLRFCTTEAEKTLFIKGFDSGLEFWRQFWTTAATTISCEAARSEESA